MKCPFRCSKYVRWDAKRAEALVHEDFENCHGDECPCYYTDENDVEKCSRCYDGPEEEL